MTFTAKDIELIVHSYFRDQFQEKNIDYNRPDAGEPEEQERDSDGRDVNADATRSLRTGRQTVSSFVYILDKLTDDFRSCQDTFNQLKEKVDTVVTNLETTLSPDRFDEGGYVIFIGIADHLLAEDIKWHHVLTLFVYAFELASEFYSIKNDPVVIEQIAGWLINYISARLMDWMNTHGTTNGLVEYANTPGTRSNLRERRFWKRAVMIGGFLAFVSISMQLLHQH